MEHWGHLNITLLDLDKCFVSWDSLNTEYTNIWFMVFLHYTACAICYLTFDTPIQQIIALIFVNQHHLVTDRTHTHYALGTL